MNQKELSKQYDWIKNKKLECFIGRKPSKYKHIELEVSLTKKENVFGAYAFIMPQITRTHFNGSVLELEVRHLNNHYGLKILKNEIDNLTLHM